MAGHQSLGRILLKGHLEHWREMGQISAAPSHAKQVRQDADSSPLQNAPHAPALRWEMIRNPCSSCSITCEIPENSMDRDMLDMLSQALFLGSLQKR